MCAILYGCVWFIFLALYIQEMTLTATALSPHTRDYNKNKNVSLQNNASCLYLLGTDGRREKCTYIASTYTHGWNKQWHATIINILNKDNFYKFIVYDMVASAKCILTPLRQCVRVIVVWMHVCTWGAWDVIYIAYKWLKYVYVYRINDESNVTDKVYEGIKKNTKILRKLSI